MRIVTVQDCSIKLHKNASAAHAQPRTQTTQPNFVGGEVKGGERNGEKEKNLKTVDARNVRNRHCRHENTQACGRARRI